MAADGTPNASRPPPRPPARCPVCNRSARAESRPFCSTRCREVDLSRWLTGAYAIPGEAVCDDDAEE